MILAPATGVPQDSLLANNSSVTTGSLEYKQLKALRFRLTDTDTDRTVKINLTHLGKARIRIIGEDNQEYLSKEFTANTERTQNLSCSLASEPDQLYLVTLELMADPSGGVLEARNARLEANWGDPTTLGKLVTQPVRLNEDARIVRLSWNGTGVSFMVSTDSGKTWESVENGKATVLRNPGNRLVLKAMLQMAGTTVLDSYSVEINPANFSLFTGKMLTEETGLVYFGARWYDPEVGRWITPDPAEDGENWYAFCFNNPTNNYDPDGQYTFADDVALFVGGGLINAGIELGFQAWNRKYDVSRVFTAFIKGGLSSWLAEYIGPCALGVYAFLDGVEEGTRAKLACQGLSESVDTFTKTFMSDMFSGIVGGALGKGVVKIAGKLAPIMSEIMNKFKLNFARSNIAFKGSAQVFASDLSHITGKAGISRNRAIQAVISEDLSNVKLTYTPKYSPFIRTGVAKQGVGTQIGKGVFSSRKELIDTIIHEELHHRWWSRGIMSPHHGSEYIANEKFYDVVERFIRMKGFN